jgi:hypothetical protein
MGRGVRLGGERGVGVEEGDGDAGFGGLEDVVFWGGCGVAYREELAKGRRRPVEGLAEMIWRGARALVAGISRPVIVRRKVYRTVPE